MKIIAMLLMLVLGHGEAALARTNISSQLAKLAKIPANSQLPWKLANSLLPWKLPVEKTNSALFKQLLGTMSVDNPDGVVIGIDLGTTNSAMAWVQEGSDVPVIIINLEGGNTTPSAVNVGDGSVGETALRNLDKSTILSAKRFIGQKLRELEEKKLLGNLPFDVVADDKGRAVFEVDGKQYLPEEISAQVLGKLKRDAERTLGKPVTGAVITVPARFNNTQRSATIAAAEIAGLEVLRIIAEPTAAALAHGFGDGEAKTIAVYDLGGGTFDISIVEMGATSDGNEFGEVRTTEGDSLLGGDDFDNLIVDFLVEDISQKHGVDVSSDQEAMAELREAAVDAKKDLTNSESTNIRIRKLGEQSLTVDTTLSRARFESMIEDPVARTITMTEKALANEDYTVDDIDFVVMVGGSTRVPRINEAVEALFGAEKIRREDNPDEVVALGAAIQAAIISGNVGGVTFIDVTSTNLGIGLQNGKMAVLIEKGTAIPHEVVNQDFTTVVDNQSSVEVVIYQGDADLVEFNEAIGQLVISNIPPALAGVPRFEVTFEIDANGVLKVKVKDLGTGKDASVTVAADALSDEKLEELRKTAEENAEYIEQQTKLLDARGKLDGLAVQAEALLRESGDKLADEAKTSLQTAIEAAKKSLDSDDLEALENSIKAFQDEIYEITEQLYGKAENSDS